MTGIKLEAKYDPHEDKLNLTIVGAPEGSYPELRQSGLIFWFSLADDMLSGVDVIGYRGAWMDRKEALAREISIYAGIPPASVEDLLPRLTQLDKPAGPAPRDLDVA